MHLALRSCAMAGAVLVGTGMVAVGPVVAPPVPSGLVATGVHQLVNVPGTGYFDNVAKARSDGGGGLAGSAGPDVIDLEPPGVVDSVGTVDIRLTGMAVEPAAGGDPGPVAIPQAAQSPPVDDEPIYCAAIGCRPGEPGYPLGASPGGGEPVYCAAIGCRPGEPGYPLGDTEPVYCAAIGCRPGEPGYPLGGTPVDDEPIYCAAIGCRPGEPGYPLGGTPVDDEPIHCAAIGCRPGEPGYPLGSAQPAGAPVLEIAIPAEQAGDNEADNPNDSVGAPSSRGSTELSHGSNNGATTNPGDDGAGTPGNGSEGAVSAAPAA